MNQWQCKSTEELAAGEQLWLMTRRIYNSLENMDFFLLWDLFFLFVGSSRLKASASNPSQTSLPAFSPSSAIEQGFVGFPQLDSIFTSGNTNQEKFRENITRNNNTHSG